MNEDQFEMAETIRQATVDAGIARATKYTGISADNCVECDEEIPVARQIAVPGVQRCVLCQGLLDLKEQGVRRV